MAHFYYGALKIIVFTAVLAATTLNGNAQSAVDPDERDEGRNLTPGPAKPAEDPLGPRRHFRVPNPANISDQDAQKAYDALKRGMARGYGMSEHPAAKVYTKWKRYNTAPYLSAGHGRRFLNTHGNVIAKDYSKYEAAGRFPVGSILAKDSIAITADGKVNPGPLFLMEKMSEGFNHVSGDWKYTMIMPDGSIFGITNGTGAKQVKFCVPCHLAAEENDHLHFLPERLRVTQ
ncbi:MAG: cytochrome P460 family protein [Alphaproteobacteria bacterium]|nr:cytochrome P460 family protein [Alphaproteobacteria bacterium]